MYKKQTLVALTGPTTAGETALSLALAKMPDEEVISANSMQVYRHMDIRTVKVTAAEMQGVPYHLIDILEPEKSFDAVHFQKLAKQAIEETRTHGKVPTLVDGTGFCLQTVFYEAPFSEESRDEATHAALTERRAREGIASPCTELSAVDPEAAAQVYPSDEKRVLHALEYSLSSGERISRHNIEARKRQSPYALSYFVLNMERQSLYRRIDTRVEAVFQAGLVGEIRSLAARGMPRAATSMQGIGYHELFDHLDGEADLLHCKELVKLGTRHFVKRQLTWFRRKRDTGWFLREDYASEQAIAAEVLRRMEKRREETR